jgi:hypothetical protein
MKRICLPNDRPGASAAAKLQIYVGNSILPEAAALAAALEGSLRELPLRLSDVFSEKFECAGSGEFCALIMEVSAVVAIETVAGWIDEDFRIGVGAANFVDVGHGDAMIVFAEMHHHRVFRLFVIEHGDLATIVTGAGVNADTSCSKPGHRAAPAIADAGDFSDFRGFQRFDGGGDILDQLHVYGCSRQKSLG